MTLPASGPLSADNLLAELGLPARSSISLGQANVRALAGQASGPVDMNTLHGKSQAPVGASYSFVSNTDTSTSTQYSTGFIAGMTTAVVTPSSYKGYNVSSVLLLLGTNLWGNTTYTVPTFLLELSNPGSNVIPPKSIFTSITIVEFGLTFLSANAQYQGWPGGFLYPMSEWAWPAFPKFVLGQTYHFLIS